MKLGMAIWVLGNRESKLGILLNGRGKVYRIFVPGHGEIEVRRNRTRRVELTYLFNLGIGWRK